MLRAYLYSSIDRVAAAVKAAPRVAAARLTLLAPLLLLGACTEPAQLSETAEPTAAAPHAAAYVGAERCGDCHQAQFAAWRGSHHDLAMQTPSASTVLGNFSDAQFDYEGLLSRLTRRDGAFVVTTDNASGELQDFEVRFTFGAYPLQQYLLEQPGGRLQALGIAWDSRTQAQGGGRWFHLHPEGGVTSADVLHWTTGANNWNSMCADCHSTNLRKNYDTATRTYATSYSEINVACEACHGPGAGHTAAAQAGRVQPMPAALATQPQQINACAQCHSRRSQLQDGFEPQQPFLDSYLPSLLDADLYHSDGQILDEVYVYGSFLQSRMHARGVTCSNCHDPHSARLKLEGNAVCTQCHSPQGREEFPTLKPGAYDARSHHQHTAGTDGAACVNCHMPARTYMVVDDRRDHSFRLPRPDLTSTLGVPNACNGCHTDRSPEWAAAAIATWFGPSRREHYGTVLAAAGDGQPQAATALADLAEDATQPAIVRATALALMAAYQDPITEAALLHALGDSDPLVRIGALRGVARLAPRVRWQVAGTLLKDPLRAVRVEAARTLAPTYGSLLPADRRALELGLETYLETLAFNADRAEAQSSMAAVYMHRQQPEKAEAALKTALELNPQWVPAMVNLADLFRATARDALGGELLARAQATAPDSADVLTARALWLVRQQRTVDAVPLLARAYELAPGTPRYAYLYAVALYSTGAYPAAMAVLDAALAERPDDQDLVQAAMGFAAEQGDMARAQSYAEHLVPRT